MNKKYRISKLEWELLSFFGGNSFSVNILLMLFVIFFTVAGVDLSSELAKDKHEIDFVLDSLEDSCNIPQLFPKGLEEITRPLLAAIPIAETYISFETRESTNDDRGPPSA
ncbi:MAG: hypothetical protein IT280_10055 [Ignavibacteria bacterium]|nr:hypothetical protein [Ignavibacteria bacterium]